jgi:hypothetical protein
MYDGFNGPGNSPNARTLLDLYADKTWIPPKTWTTLSVSKAELRRVRRNALMAGVAVDIPRRLGLDAPNVWLAADKKFARRLLNVYWTTWRMLVYSKQSPFPPEGVGIGEDELIPPHNWVDLLYIAGEDEAARRAGRTVIWHDWWNEYLPKLEKRRRVIASFAHFADEPRWGWRVLTEIGHEIENVEQALSDLGDAFDSVDP